MSSSFAAWVDHNEAKIIDISSEEAPPVHLKRRHRPHHSHHPKDGMPESDHAFFEAVAQALLPAKEILLMGPGITKTKFVHFLTTHRAADFAGRVAGIENADHPSEGQIRAVAKKFFHARHQLEGTAPLAWRR